MADKIIKIKNEELLEAVNKILDNSPNPTLDLSTIKTFLEKEYRILADEQEIFEILNKSKKFHSSFKLEIGHNEDACTYFFFTKK